MSPAPVAASPQGLASAFVVGHLTDTLKSLVAAALPMVTTLLAFAGPQVLRAVIQSLTPMLRAIPTDYRRELDVDLHEALVGDLP